MGMPPGLPVLDTFMNVPMRQKRAQYLFMHRQLKDDDSKEMEFPAEYMFKDHPTDREDTEEWDPVAYIVDAMDRCGVAQALILADPDSKHFAETERALTTHPDRFFLGSANFDPNDVMGTLRRIERHVAEHDVKMIQFFPSGNHPQVPINDPKMYAIYAKCVELGVPASVCAGVPGPRLPMMAQHVEHIDEVMYDFPELVLITRHGCEPWEELMVKLMLKWPNLYYSTSAFAPKHYPRAIIDFANTRGADKVIYAGYFPDGLSLDRIFDEMPHVPFRDHVWPKFLHENARRVLGLPTP
jgi:hypothetical protein